MTFIENQNIDLETEYNQYFTDISFIKKISQGKIDLFINLSESRVRQILVNKFYLLICQKVAYVIHWWISLTLNQRFNLVK